jgi:hypothetical protein
MEPKTKEEIFDEAVGSFHRSLAQVTYGNICKAMDTYAEQEQKKLLKYLREELFITHDPEEVLSLYKQTLI